MFPWQSGSNGREETQQLHLNPKSGRWLPDHSHLQRHVNIAIAYNVWQHYHGHRRALAVPALHRRRDADRDRPVLGQPRRPTTPQLDRYEILGVMGPDEYHDAYPDSDEAGPAQQHLHQRDGGLGAAAGPGGAARSCRRTTAQELVEELAIRDEELDRWRDITRKMTRRVPRRRRADPVRGLRAACRSSTGRATGTRYGNIQRLDRVLEAEGDSTEPLQGRQAGRRADAAVPAVPGRAARVCCAASATR